MAQLFIGIIAEGSTDFRFFEQIVDRVFSKIAYDCKGNIDIATVTTIKCSKGDSFNDYVLNAAKYGLMEIGINIMIVHCDADSDSADGVYANKIYPAINLLQLQDSNTHCKSLIPLIPVYETESWMLADKENFIKSIGTKKTESQLKINGNPETFTNPKGTIIEAIRLGREDMPKKLKTNLKIDELYSTLGASIRLENLNTYNSYLDFEKNIRKVLTDLNYL